MGPGMFADAAAIFIEGPIADPMQAVFNGPMAAIEREQAGWVRFLRTQAGDAIDGFGAGFPGDELGGVALDAKDLSGVGKSR